MPTVIETLAEYQAYVKYDKACKPETLRSIDASLRRFTELYGTTEVKELTASDIQLFFELLKAKKRKHKNSEGKNATVSAAYVHKVMRNIKAYVRWLYEKGYVRTLTPMEVPNINRPQAFPKYLTKEEMGKILQHVEDALAAAKRKNNDLMLYTAYLWRALVWFLYTTGLRNFEIRKLEMQDLNMDELSGTILGKGDKLAIFTYNHTAKEKLATYLAIRKKVFPKRKFKHLFTPYSADSEQGLSAF